MTRRVLSFEPGILTPLPGYRTRGRRAVVLRKSLKSIPFGIEHAFLFHELNSAEIGTLPWISKKGDVTMYHRVLLPVA
jgi:hypothetical protein